MNSQSDPQFEPQPSRFVVGIDLGTTNSAVCYVDTTQRPWHVKVLEIPQLVAPDQIENRDTLPSFHFQPVATPHPQPLSHKGRGEPNYVVGFMARDHGSGTPGRAISSAKSWLCHTGVDRTADLLPWHAAADVERISPVEASSRYLAHIRSAWNNKFKTEPLERQDIVLTLPASFDEIARELTVQAAARAGLARVVLIEEPQAAFYAWIYKHQDDWEQLVEAGQKILVCDIGGGTTDFTLIRVEGDTTAAKVQFHRVAVGDHLILGGDNMDLALAQHLEGKLSGARLLPRQWDVLLRLARQAKEQLLTESGPEQLTITIPGSGSKLIGGSLSVQITKDEARQVLVEGFMPRVELNDKPAARRSGFQEFGLPYAADPAMTRYLAAFLSAHRWAGVEDRGECGASRGSDDPARPGVLLFNGGVFESPLLRQRLIDCLGRWFDEPPVVLDNDRLDLAVARGAAYYGMVRRGEGVRIVASLARTYYIGVESASANHCTPLPQHLSHLGSGEIQPPTPSALCLVPGNAQPGQDIELARDFDLLVSEPVEFPLYTSSVRLTDRPGQLVPFDPEQMTPLPPIRTALKTKSRKERGVVRVHLHARLTEIGTLELWCSEVHGSEIESNAARPPRTWRLQFDVRSATQTDVAAHATADEAQGFVDEATAAAMHLVLQETFGPAATGDPATLIKRLVEAAASDRPEWPTSLLRRVWEMLMELEPGRRKSPQHEARWLNLLGYALRPGFGLAVDDWRVAETWKTLQGKLAHAAPTSRTESLILWRRIAGGLSAGQQRALAEPLLATVRTLFKRQTSGKATDPTFSPHEALEVLRLLGSLELLPGETKTELGDMLAELVSKKKLEPIRQALLWAIGRLGARHPAYGPLNTVVPPATAAVWIEKLLHLDASDAMIQFSVVNLARRTGDRFRDLDDGQRQRVLEWLASRTAGEHALKLVRAGGELDVEEQGRVFGDSLPKGLRIRE